MGKKEIEFRDPVVERVVDKFVSKNCDLLSTMAKFSSSVTQCCLKIKFINIITANVKSGIPRQGRF